MVQDLPKGLGTKRCQTAKCGNAVARQGLVMVLRKRSFAVRTDAANQRRYAPANNGHIKVFHELSVAHWQRAGAEQQGALERRMIVTASTKPACANGRNAQACASCAKAITVWAIAVRWPEFEHGWQAAASWFMAFAREHRVTEEGDHAFQRPTNTRSCAS